jgi:hypothetical protein
MELYGFGRASEALTGRGAIGDYRGEENVCCRGTQRGLKEIGE